ncbi:sensor histidine kinase [Allosalinactinospora lopnorensis]|uniref:sensor histidine kinase n=1 Tax=Allosalinactinospora lopnorensis TaxID=1352348 RepID=UPI000623C627|nr:HAMP domain-containing sensor histidine kinase [Allosalinactinospora lopnorensis]
MLRRLLAILLPLTFLLVAALVVPLGTAMAQRETQEVYVDRLSDAGRFASLSHTALRTGRTDALRAELERYQELYGIRVLVADPSGDVVAASQSGGTIAGLLDAPDARQAMTKARAGVRPEPPPVLWPWKDDPLVVAEPIGRDSELVGVVLLVSPADGLHSAILAGWAWLALLSLVPLAGLAAATWPLSRWALRPVHRLDGATAAIAHGDLSVRVDAAGGPPELRRLTGSFNAMVDAVESSSQRQRAFVSDASHQLRNPLTSLRMAVENLAPFLSGPEARSAHEDAVEETRAMHRTLNSLLAATRLESFGAAEPADLDSVLATRVPRWQALSTEYGITLRTRVPEGVRLLAPPGGLGSVLDEVMSNAMRLSGGTRVELRAEPDERVELHLADNGMGLSDEERESALRRFWRAPKHQNLEGTGLGLAICADLVRSAGGELRLEPGLPRPEGGGHGLDVVLALPAAPASSP